jgi:hypothetical protein
MHPGGHGTDAGAGLISGFRKKHRFHLLFRCSLDLNPFTGLHVMNVLGNLAGMVTTAFEIPGYEDIVGAAGNTLGIFHHVGNCFAEDRLT